MAAHECQIFIRFFLISCFYLFNFFIVLHTVSIFLKDDYFLFWGGKNGNSGPKWVKTPWFISITSETYNENYTKPTNLPHSLGNLRGNIYKLFLLLIITLHLTCGKRKFWRVIKKFQKIITTNNIKTL